MMANVVPLFSNLQYAAAYARRGWPVFPLHGVVDGRCTCGDDCGNPGKHPRTRHGLKEATLDEPKIRAWWQKWPDANIAIATGSVSGLLVIDCDPRSGGNETWAKLILEHGVDPMTVTCDTGGGGWHAYLQRPEGDRIKSRAGWLGPGIDIKCDGGYVCAPPSSHASGKCYAFREGFDPKDCDVQPCPEWVRLAISDAPAKRTRTKQVREVRSIGGSPARAAAPADPGDGWIVTAFRAAGWLGESREPGKWEATCPWASEHTTGPSGAVVFAPSGDRTMGWFHCPHAHCVGKGLDDVRAALPEHARLEADRAYPARSAEQPDTLEGDWRANLIRKADGSAIPCHANVISILTHDQR